MDILDILILGSGPAALCLASELEERGNLATEHKYDYGLINQEAFQNELLKRCKGIQWLNETAKVILSANKISEVVCISGLRLKARLVIDASGHRSNFIKRPYSKQVAQQAAYGIVGKFSIPPVNKDQFVLMDFRSDHLNKKELLESPSFLYAMDLGNEIFFVEETSLASFPALSQENLKKRLLKRLSNKDIKVEKIIHEENCLFPMNLPLPFKDQSILAFGGAASMVHPASGYMIGSLLRRAPHLARKLAISLKDPKKSSFDLAKKGWSVLWPYELTQRHKLYQYGLKRLMSFDEKRLRSFFINFFQLSTKEWVGFLTNTLPLPKLIYVMSKMFIKSPLRVKLGMLNIK